MVIIPLKKPFFFNNIDLLPRLEAVAMVFLGEARGGGVARVRRRGRGSAMLGKERAKGTSERVVRVRAQQREGREQGSAERGERAKGTTLWKERVRFSRERG